MHRRTFLTSSAFVGLGLASTACTRKEVAATQEPAERIEEPALEPGLAIIDPHHHLWDKRLGAAPFMLKDLVGAIARSGHNITQTVYLEAGSMYRADGPVEMRPVGEVEFVNGVAAMSASGEYGPCRVASGIVGAADFSLGDGANRVFDAEIAAGDGRLKGIRALVFATDVQIMGSPKSSLLVAPGMLAKAKVREAMKGLAPRNLSLDIGCFHTQLQDVADVAAVLSNTTIVLNHMATPLRIGRFAANPAETFASWKKGMTEVAKRPNVVVKCGGLGQNWSQPIGHLDPPTSSTKLAEDWKPWIETTIELFGHQRCMFESNFPVDEASCTYGALWNAFKRIAANYSADEKAALFSGVAKRVYRLV